MDKSFHPILYNEFNNLPMMGLKLMHVSKRRPWWHADSQSEAMLKVLDT